MGKEKKDWQQRHVYTLMLDAAFSQGWFWKVANVHLIYEQCILLHKTSFILLRCFRKFLETQPKISWHQGMQMRVQTHLQYFKIIAYWYSKNTDFSGFAWVQVKEFPANLTEYFLVISTSAFGLPNGLVWRHDPMRHHSHIPWWVPRILNQTMRVIRSGGRERASAKKTAECATYYTSILPHC